MVPVVVLHKKVQVEGGGKQNPGADLVRRLGAVPQFVGYVDAQYAAAQAHAQYKAHAVRQGVGPMPPKHVQERHEAGDLDGNDGAKGGVEPRVLQRFLFLFRAQVARVRLPKQLHQRDGAKGIQQRRPRPNTAPDQSSGQKDGQYEDEEEGGHG